MLLGESEIRRRISLIADSSLASRAASDSWLAPVELRERAVVPLGRFGISALPLRALASLLLALERRLIAFPKAQDKTLHRVRLACWR
jgi:hypothetical protein